MLKLCKNHSKSFKVPFGEQERKKERENGVIFSLCVRSLLPSLPLLLSILVCFFPPQSSFVIIPFHPHSVSSSHHHHHHLPPRSYFSLTLPPFLSLSLSYSLHFLLLLSIKLWQPTKTKRITTQGIGI